MRLIPAHAGKTPACDAVHTLPRAHPRSRGENPKTRSEPHLGPGSSPLTRGKRVRQRSGRPPMRLIPAHAGKTQGGDPAVGRTGAHPRSRGENNVVVRFAHNAQGSSPLTRGKQRTPRHEIPRLGLIPAHAGKTSRKLPVNAAFWAHPRSRGENPSVACSFTASVGSSPLTRGKPPPSSPSPRPRRLIPAHAGKTRGRSKTPCAKPAHPRSRGENL